MKKSYINSPNKRLVQDDVFSQVRGREIRGLGGPTPGKYVDILRMYGFTKIFLYENKKRIYLSQLANPPSATLIYGDILSDLEHKCFYDLDFCCSVQGVLPYLEEIAALKQYSITLSLRPIGLEKTISTMAQYDKNLQYITYRDNYPMITLYKVF